MHREQGSQVRILSLRHLAVVDVADPELAPDRAMVSGGGCKSFDPASRCAEYHVFRSRCSPTPTVTSVRTSRSLRTRVQSVFERAVATVSVQVIRRLLAPGKTFQHRAVHKEDVEPSIVVVVTPKGIGNHAWVFQCRIDL